jgi:uncharacterized protein (UPF0264 family)
MTRFLASVRSAAEAELVLCAGADIVDLKDPSQGALGAVDLGTIEACVASIAGRASVSATAGDLPMEPAPIADAVQATAACGVDYVKLGLFPGGDALGCLRVLEAQASRVGLILVLFADAMPAFDAVSVAAGIGARGVMLDTAKKDGGSLLDHMAIGEIAKFVNAARREGLIAGVAGSLRTAHVAPLLALSPDLVGFRGALCRDGARGAGLDPVACSGVRALIPAEKRQPEAELREAHASALC